MTVPLTPILPTTAGVAMISSMDFTRLIDLTSQVRSVQISPKSLSLPLLQAFLHDVLVPVGAWQSKTFEKSLGIL